MVRQPNLQANFQPNLQPNIVYKQNIFNLSVSYADSSLYQREPCSVDYLNKITATNKYSQSSHQPWLHCARGAGGVSRLRGCFTILTDDGFAAKS